jgi:hypothetical protein
MNLTGGKGTHIFVLLLCYVVKFVTSFTIPESEYNALQNLFDSTQGELWKWKNTMLFGSPWDFSNATSDPCINQWQGLTCSRWLQTHKNKNALYHREIPNSP